MAALLAVALVAFLAIAQPTLARPEQASTPNFEQLLKEFQTTLEKSFSDTKKNLNLPENPDGAAIVKALREQTTKAEKAFGDLKKNIDETIKKNPEISGALNNLKSKLDEAKEKLKKDNPEVAANAQKIADTLKTAYESLGKEAEKINSEVNKKGGIRDDMDNLLKLLIDRGSAAAKEFQTKVNEAIKQATEKKA